MCMMNKTLVSLLTFPVVSILSEMYNFHTHTIRVPPGQIDLYSFHIEGLYAYS